MSPVCLNGLFSFLTHTPHACATTMCVHTLAHSLAQPNTQAKLLEHNVRFGDPECQGLMARLDSDLVEALIKVRVGFTEGSSVGLCSF